MDDVRDMTQRADDAALEAALAEVRDAACAHFEHDEAQVRLGQWLSPLEPQFHVLADRVLPAFRAHPELAGLVSRAFGPKQIIFEPTYQVGNLIRVAAKLSPQEAIDWLRRARKIDKADLRYVAEVYGVKVERETHLSNGVTLVPLANLPPSENARAVQAQFYVRPGGPNVKMAQAIGAYYCVRGVSDKREELPSVRSEVLERTIQAFSLVGTAAPVTGTYWLECIEPDLVQAEFGRIFGGFRSDGHVPEIPHNLTEADLAMVERYIRFPAGRQARLGVALGRLNRARRRLDPGDQAIETGICLESLLGDENDQQDLSHKVRTRAALLLGAGLEERKAIRDDAKRLYNLRSTTVHGRSPKPNDWRKDHDVAARGLDVATRVVHAIFSREDEFDPTALDLSG